MERLNITVGVDWGSSSFRAYRFDSSGEMVDKIDQAAGIKTVTDQNFENVLFESIGHWLQPGDAILFSGMITSRNGWMETPYLECPVSLHQLGSKSSVKKISNDIAGLFLPGLSMRTPADVMRGEELQLYGALSHDEQLVILPGTHSKWACVRAGVVEKFHTVVTGELFELLINHSLVGGLATSIDFSEKGFNDGVRSGYASKTIVSQLFVARSGVLLEQLNPNDVYSYISGLLIGNEIKESDTVFSNNLPILLVGADSLIAKYLSAFELLGISAEVESRDAAALGFQKIIKEQTLV